MAMPTNVLALPLAHLVMQVSNNEDWIDSLVFLVADSGVPLQQLDLRGIDFQLHVRRRPEIHEVILSASTYEHTLYLGSPPNVGYLLFYIPRRTMNELWPGNYVGDIRARDANFERITLTLELTVLQGITRP